MTVTYVNQSTGVTAGGTTVSFSYNTAAGTNHGLFIGAMNFAGIAISSATHNSVAMTNAATSGSLKAFVLAGQAEGSQTVAFTLSSYSASGVRYTASDWTDVNQSTPSGTPVTNSGSGTSTATTGSVTVPSGGAAVGYVFHDYITTLTNTVGTETGQTLNGGGSGLGGSRSGSTVNFTWTTAHNGAFNAIGLPINSATGGGSSIAAVSNYYSMMRAA